MEYLPRMKELKDEGFFCSQILILLGLEALGKENVELVRAAHGLAGGIGFTGGVCGALTGGACLLGLYAGKGKAEEEDDPRLRFMAEDLNGWFRREVGERYGGIDCDTILGGDARSVTLRCAEITAGVYQKVRELLVENGFDLTGGGDE
jgi:C_GCAxxG_C_C family probable redox protein